MTAKKKERLDRMKEYFSHINKTAFYICLSTSIALIVTSFFIPPTGVIDGSVLAATGEIFAFATLGVVIEGISSGHSVSIQKGETTMTINKDKEETQD